MIVAISRYCIVCGFNLICNYIDNTHLLVYERMCMRVSVEEEETKEMMKLVTQNNWVKMSYSKSLKS
jgi:hypothetical protein